ncbi:MAG: response regulator, partial [Alphaproteobacteria bacterium]|nr:response regulator [Alphaproteobacteria bacterium]
MALFERISVLVVEDDEFMVSLLRQILLAAGFRHIRTARNGRDAIGMLGALKASRFNPTGQQPVDIVVADAFMPTVNGIDLLRWVRQDTASPNRFLPFIMMSGEADEDLVFNCRDVGVSEILAKPFSVSTLVGKLMQVIEKPRAYILNRTFFGPDRRRMRAPLPADARERRVMTKDKIRLFTSAQTNLNVLSGHTWIFDFPNHLKGKLEVKNPQELSGPIDFARELARAETALAEAAEETKRWITNAAEELEAFLIQLRAALDGA